VKSCQQARKRKVNTNGGVNPGFLQRAQTTFEFPGRTLGSSVFKVNGRMPFFWRGMRKKEKGRVIRSEVQCKVIPDLRSRVPEYIFIHPPHISRLLSPRQRRRRRRRTLSESSPTRNPLASSAYTHHVILRGSPVRSSHQRQSTMYTHASPCYHPLLTLTVNHNLANPPISHILIPPMINLDPYIRWDHGGKKTSACVKKKQQQKNPKTRHALQGAFPNGVEHAAVYVRTPDRHP